jgi:preprotein translocase subunit YajC
MFDFLMGTAFAQATAAKQPSVLETFIVPMGGLLLIMYFLVIRPQQKKAKEAREMVAKLAVGDEVVTAGGILGRITAAGDTYLSIEIARDTTIQLQRYQVVQLLPKGTYKSV